MLAHIRHVLQYPVSSFCFELKLLDLKHISNGWRTLEFRGQPSVSPPSRPIRQIHCYNHVDLHTKGLNPKLSCYGTIYCDITISDVIIMWRRKDRYRLSNWGVMHLDVYTPSLKLSMKQLYIKCQKKYYWFYLFLH